MFGRRYRSRVQRHSRKYQRERPGPERARQCVGRGRDDACVARECACIGQMNDQRMVGRTAFDAIDRATAAGFSMSAARP